VSSPALFTPGPGLLDAESFQVRYLPLLRTLLNNLSEGILVADAQGTLIHVSSSAERMLGLGPSSGVPSKWSVLGLFHPDEQTPFPPEQLPIWRALKGEEVRDVDLFVLNERVRPGRHLRCQFLPLRDEQEHVIGGVALMKDMGQARQREAEFERHLAERTAQLEVSNRELEAFAYSVAHDLRAPLRAITSFSDAMKEDCSDRLDALGLDYLKRIRGGAQRMSELIDGILALSRVNRASLVSSQCDLSALARSVAEQFQSQFPQRVVRLSIQEGLVDRGDPQLLRSVLENLLGNAWKFTRNRPVAEITFGASQEQGVRTYFIRDNGAGFDMAYQHKLFGVFQRLHAQAEFEGNGIGLACVQRIIRLHGGRVRGEGQPDHGACFFFTLNELPLPPAASIPPGAPA
jgi:signal transduction histidine kinase